MSDTPRTGEAQFGTGRVSVDFARQLERELNAANAEIEEKRKDIVYLATEKSKLEERIERLEEALKCLILVVGLTPIAGNKNALQEAMDIAIAELQAKEAKL